MISGIRYTRHVGKMGQIAFWIIKLFWNPAAINCFTDRCSSDEALKKGIPFFYFFFPPQIWDFFLHFCFGG